MAESQNIAFGRYLRTLRERRNLSLQDVCSLSQAFAETLNKGYLSRCENGRQSLALSKVIPLSRIYQVPGDVLLERLELDQELDRVGSPDTEGIKFAELTAAGTKAINQGSNWDAYAYLRDAVARSTVDPVKPSFRDAAEQSAVAQMNCGTAVFRLGRNRFALHEFKYAEESGHIGSRFNLLVLQRMSSAYRTLGEHDLAREYADRAVAEAEEMGEREYLGFLYAARATQAFRDSDLELAASVLKKTYRAFRDVDSPEHCAWALTNLAQVFFDLSRYRAARRSLRAAENLLRPHREHRSYALGRILLGEIERLEKHEGRASAHWREAARIAQVLNDKTLRFKAEFLLLQQAVDKGESAVARSIHRRLRKLANWVPNNTPELKDYRELTTRIAI